jgi:hypothetical protein
MGVRSAIPGLEKRRGELVRRLLAAETRIGQIRAEMSFLDQLEAEARATREAVARIDATILVLDPDWQPTLPRGRPSRAGGRR